MFKPLWLHGRAICFADGWFEWKRERDKKQPYFIHCKDGKPIFMAVIGSVPFERGDEAEGFLIVAGAADQGPVDIHDRRPLVLAPEAAREWMRQDIGGKEAEKIAADGTLSADKFIWYAVTRAVGNVKNRGAELLESNNPPAAIEQNLCHMKSPPNIWQHHNYLYLPFSTSK
jgi:putative SOS response-associated peptidase YedK